MSLLLNIWAFGCVGIWMFGHCLHVCKPFEIVIGRLDVCTFANRLRLVVWMFARLQTVWDWVFGCLCVCKSVVRVLTYSILSLVSLDVISQTFGSSEIWNLQKGNFDI